MEKVKRNKESGREVRSSTGTEKLRRGTCTREMTRRKTEWKQGGG